VLMITTTDLTWLMSTCFFLGSFLAFLNNVVQRFGKDLSPILGDLSPALVIAWLFLVGSGAFTHMSYKILHDTFDGKEHAKEVLGACVRYASYYHHDSAEIWIKYNANNGLDKMSLFRLLEESYIIIMPESEIDELFQEIDVDCNGVLCKDKIEAYLDVGLLNRQIASFSFWSNFSWFLGSIAYIIPLYINDSITAKVCDIVSFHYILFYSLVSLVSIDYLSSTCTFPAAWIIGVLDWWNKSVLNYIRYTGSLS
jgi:hypothetical protein